MLPFLLLKSKQMQAGADWDSVTNFTVIALLVAGGAFLLVLIVSRILKRSRMKNAAIRARRRHK